MERQEASTASALDARIAETVQQYWGFSTLRPLQAEAIAAGLQQQDSLVVLPTGGGKSLCYQVPPIVADRIDVVVSPLISLMKDQVDGLRSCGYPAAAIHSNLAAAERRAVEHGLSAGEYRLIFVSPERLATPWFQQQLERLNVRAFAIDEAHCISHWGHDFRPEYRQLALLKTRFPNASVHAFTATATPRVRDDIVQQLQLREPNVIVGPSDRPNLVYRILPRVDVNLQAIEVIRRHPREAVIVYCISRRDTEALAAVLAANGINAAAYHAGMGGQTRRKTQEAFAEERLDVVVATVAFGMGIDRSDVRAVIHTAMPKSIEHYQQETGRAGRDGLEAECVLLYSAADVLRWQGLMERQGEDGAGPGGPDAEAQQVLLRHMQGLASTLECRHRALSRYFGDDYASDNCGACDVCLDEVEAMPESTVIARKILSGVARLQQRYGVGHLVQVLRGAATEAVRRWGHDRLTTYGLLRELPEKSVTNLVYQLVDQDLLQRSSGDRPVLSLTAVGMEVLKGERSVALVEPKSGPIGGSKMSAESWEGVDRGLYEHLRQLRRQVAQDRAVPAFVIFGDRTLRDLARIRPTGEDTFSQAHGVGRQKLADLGPIFLEAITAYCVEEGLSTNQAASVAAAPAIVVPKRARPNPERDRAIEMFREGASLDSVVAATGRTRTTVAGYLEQLITEDQFDSLEPWVDGETYDRVAAAIEVCGTERLRPIYEHLNESVDYDSIRLVVAHQALLAADADPP